MNYTATAIILFLLVLILSVLVSNLANIVSTDEILEEKFQKDVHKGNAINQKVQVPIRDDNKHLMWFVQLSDLHISAFQDSERVEKLNQFLNHSIDIIKPSVVLASGDLTDAKDRDQLGSRQYKREWEIYKNILVSSNIENKTIWLDIRGNHDNFNVARNSSENYFTKYSVQGRKHSRSYLQQVKVGEETYSFIAIDACLEPGPKRPFNFIGILTPNETSYIVDLAEEARNRGGNYTIWFGHYPTSCILASGTKNGGLRGLIGRHDQTVAYMCGHLHTLAGLAHNMYTLQKDGFLELELGDWKDNRFFRLAAFDHGLFSFVDVKYGEWPIVLITNPKNVLYYLPRNDELAMQQQSTHIRLLVFSHHPVTSCHVKIDDGEWFECFQKSDNLFVVKWSPEKYKRDMHKLSCLVKTGDGREKLVNQSFSFDGSYENFSLLSRIILMMDASKLFQVLFSISLLSCLLPLCILRILHVSVISGRLKKPRIRNEFCRRMIRKFWILSSVDRLILPLVLYSLYIIIGPWSIGEVIDGHMGVIFLWGIFVDNTFLPGTLTYLYGFFQLAFCQLPMTIILAYATDRRFLVYRKMISTQRGKVSKCFSHLPFMVITSVEVMLAVTFWYYYGTLAFVIGPFRTWSIVLNCALYYLANNLPGDALMSAANVWHL